MKLLLQIISIISLITLFKKTSAQFVCQEDGFFHDSYDCAKFYRCDSGRKYEFTCGPGTVFNANHNGCDWPSSVPDCMLLKAKPHHNQNSNDRIASGSSHQIQPLYPNNNFPDPYNGNSGQNEWDSSQQRPPKQRQQKYGDIHSNNENYGDDYYDQFSEKTDGFPTDRQKNKKPIPHRRPPQRKYATTTTVKYDEYDDNNFDEIDSKNYENNKRIDETRNIGNTNLGAIQGRHRIPPAIVRTRPPITTKNPVDIKEDNRRIEDTDEEFMELFNYGLRKDSDDSSLDNKDYLTFEDWLKFDSTDITTKTPFYSSRVGQSNPNSGKSNTSTLQKKYGQQSITTTIKPKTTTNKRQRRPTTTTTTPNPFAEWLKQGNRKKLIDNNNNRQITNGLISGRNQFKDDPLKIPNFMVYLSCNETAIGCDTCPEFDWIKYSGLALQSLPYKSYKFMTAYVVKQCFKSCLDTQQCIAYAYSPPTGMCHLYSELIVDTIASNENWILVLQNPNNGLLLEEWLYTKNGKFLGKEFSTLNTDNYLSCLRECSKSNECRALDFDLSKHVCKLYNEFEGSSVNALKIHSIALQHMSIFNEDNNEWRFSYIGQKVPKDSEAFQLLYANNKKECFYECLENSDNKCAIVVIEDINKDNVLCRLYEYQWAVIDDENVNSYILIASQNHSLVQQYSGYSYVGNPVEVKENLTPDECREYATEKCDYCRKYTAVVETKECALFSDSALLSPAIETGLNEVSGLISIPKDWEYLAFKRIPWIMFNVTQSQVNPYELRGEVNGQKCLEFCLQQKHCAATVIVYDITDNIMFCYFFKEEDLQRATIIEYENTDLFVKIYDNDIIPSPSKSSDGNGCSDGQPLEDAAGNMEDFDGDINIIRPSLSNDDLLKNNDPLLPHGYDFYGGPNDENEDQYQASNIRHSRDVRNQQKISGKLDENIEVSPKLEENNAMAFIHFIQSASKSNSIDSLPTVYKDIRKLAKRKRFDSQSANKQTNKRLTKKCVNNEFSTYFDDNQCEDIKKKSTCDSIPSIIYADMKAMNSCIGTEVGVECNVICKTGYEPDYKKVKCETIGKNGDKNIWQPKQVKCIPDESLCEESPQNSDNIKFKARSDKKIHYAMRYDKSKRLPQFVSYFHTRDNNENNLNKSGKSAPLLKQIRCQKLNNFQLTRKDYRKSGYNIKPLIAKTAFSYSAEADLVSSYATLTAPQDPFTARGPWSSLENRTLEMLKTRPGIVITGVCPNSIQNETSDIQTVKRDDNTKPNKTVEIPECFWKIVCVPIDAEVTAAVFYAENSHPVSQLAKQSRVEQVRQYRGQEFIARLLGAQLYRDLWQETFEAYKDLNPNMKLFVSKCATARSINSREAVQFWDYMTKRKDFGENWPLNFAYGLEKTDEEIDSSEAESRDNANLKANPFDDEFSGNNNCLDNSDDNSGQNSKIIGYITSRGNKSFTESEGKHLTHVVFAHIHTDSEGNLGQYNSEDSSDKELMYSKLYEMLAVKTKLSARDKPLKTMVSIGGWNNSQHFSSIAGSPIFRDNFVSDAMHIIDYWNLDGIEIDWKYPVIGKTSEMNELNESDKKNFVTLLKQIRQSMNAFERYRGRSEPLLLSITGASGHWIIDKAYDLQKLEPFVDWIAVMTFDYYGPWKSKWGSKTGPNAPIFNSSPIDSMSKMNIDSSLKHYSCALNSSDKLVMSIPFYGNYWNNVGQAVDNDDDHYRVAQPGGGFVRYSDIKSKWIPNQDFRQSMDFKSLTPYLWSDSRSILLSYENNKSIAEKINYANEHSLGGVAVWAIDFDSADNELLTSVALSSRNQCSQRRQLENAYKCNPLKGEKRWWTDADGPKAGMCGKSGPLINGYYPVCDPDNPSSSCCSSWGRCGSGQQFCECNGCVDYGKNPQLLLKEPQKPKQTAVRWLTREDDIYNDDNDNNQPVCGYKARLLNGSYPICNPDDDNGFCCSADGFCGVGSTYCNCNDCVNFRANPKFHYHKKLWWDKNDGIQKAGRCGKLAPKINGTFAICNPYSDEAYCCGKWGFCSNGANSCDCVGCVDFKKNPFFRWK